MTQPATRNKHGELRATALLAGEIEQRGFEIDGEKRTVTLRHDKTLDEFIFVERVEYADGTHVETTTAFGTGLRYARLEFKAALQRLRAAHPNGLDGARR